jgi:hypothetical protein
MFVTTFICDFIFSCVTFKYLTLQNNFLVKIISINKYLLSVGKREAS